MIFYSFNIETRLKSVEAFACLIARMIEELKHETFERYNVVFLFYNENDSYVIETESLNQIAIKYR